MSAQLPSADAQGAGRWPWPRSSARFESRGAFRLKVFVVHLGWPRTHQGFGGSNRDAARRSLESCCAWPTLGVRLAIEVIPNELSTPASLVDLIEDVSSADLGICMDVGHARLRACVEAIEITSGHLALLHLHDNRGRRRSSRPSAGAIDWPTTVALQKVGYDGDLFVAAASSGRARNRLVKARDALRQIENMLRPAQDAEA